jgi:2,3-bisphosphoglycerate-independent phosphoglycerate mutase
VHTPHRGLMIIIDGLGDRGIPGFGGMTPLEAAETPNMDLLAGAGQVGLIDPLYPGMPVGTHTGMSMLFGLPRRQAMKLPRGPVEAAGVGINGMENALYIRCNFATLEKRGERYAILDRRAGRNEEGLKQLALDTGNLDLGEGIFASLHPATQHRVVLKLSGDRLSPAITNTDSGNRFHSRGVLTCKAVNEEDADAARTAAAINRLSDLIYQRFSHHPVNETRMAQGLLPANGVICRSPGTLPKLKPLLQYLQISAAVISGEETVLGLGNLFGYTLFRDSRFTAMPDTDLQKKVEVAQVALREHDIVFLHIKGPDICSHDLNPAAKRKMLTKIDDVIAPLMNESLVIAITGDHSTDSNTGRHTGDPMPGMICGPQCRIDSSRAFGESACAGGGLGRINSSGFLLTMLDQMNRLENFMPDDRKFFL